MIDIMHLSLPNREALVILVAVLFFSVMMWVIEKRNNKGE